MQLLLVSRKLGRSHRAGVTDRGQVEGGLPGGATRGRIEDLRHDMIKGRRPDDRERIARRKCDAGRVRDEADPISRWSMHYGRPRVADVRGRPVDRDRGRL